jgi:hypothetical protein
MLIFDLTLTLHRDHKSRRLRPPSESSPRRVLVTSWQNTVRKLLRALTRTSLDASQLADLHITLQDNDEPSVRPTLETSMKIDSFFMTSTYQGNIHCLPQYFQTRPEMTKVCSEWVASLFTCWAQDLGRQHSKNRIKFQR